MSKRQKILITVFLWVAMTFAAQSGILKGQLIWWVIIGFVVGQLTYWIWFAEVNRFSMKVVDWLVKVWE